jgi:SnoaL-like domain
MRSLTIEETVAELVAERDVRRVLASYCKGIDRCDPALMSAAFWPDARIDYGSFQASGAEVGEVIAGKRRSARVKVMMHSLTTCLVDIEADEAFAEGWYLSLRQVDTAAGVEHRWLGERYLDRLECRDDVWKIARRRAVHDFDLAQEHRPAFPAGMFLDACASPDDLSYRWRNEPFGTEVTT